MEVRSPPPHSIRYVCWVVTLTHSDQDFSDIPEVGRQNSRVGRAGVKMEAMLVGRRQFQPLSMDFS